MPGVHIASTAVVGAPFRQLLGRERAGRFEDLPDTVYLGDGVWIGHYSIVGARTSIGAGSIVDDSCYVQTDVTLGREVLITHRAHICSGSKIRDGAIIGGFIADNVEVGLRSRVFGKALHRHPDISRPWDADESREEAPYIGHDAFIGFDAKVIGGITVGDQAYVAAGAIVTVDVPPAHVATGVNNLCPRSAWRPRSTGL